MSEKQEEKIVLTLADEEQNETSEEQKIENIEEVSEEKLKETRLDDSSLSPEEKQMVEDFSKQIDITKTNSILQYGAAAQNKVADFSESALKNVKGHGDHLMCYTGHKVRWVFIPDQDSLDEALVKMVQIPMRC